MDDDKININILILGQFKIVFQDSSRTVVEKMSRALIYRYM